MTAASLLYSHTYVPMAHADVKRTVRAGNIICGPLFQNPRELFYLSSTVSFWACDGVYYLLFTAMHPTLWDNCMVKAHLTGPWALYHDSPSRNPISSLSCHMPRIPSGWRVTTASMMGKENPREMVRGGMLCEPSFPASRTFTSSPVGFTYKTQIQR